LVNFSGCSGPNWRRSARCQASSDISSGFRIRESRGCPFFFARFFFGEAGRAGAETEERRGVVAMVHLPKRNTARQRRKRVSLTDDWLAMKGCQHDKIKPPRLRSNQRH
jgi:hypothetical protein